MAPAIYHTSCDFLYITQCKNYSMGIFGGSLCSPLCDAGDIEFEKCLGHGVKLHVLKAKWKGRSVILKTSKPLGARSMRILSAAFHMPLNNNFKITRQEFMKSVSLTNCDHCANMNCFLLVSAYVIKF